MRYLKEVMFFKKKWIDVNRVFFLVFIRLHGKYSSCYGGAKFVRIRNDSVRQQRESVVKKWHHATEREQSKAHNAACAKISRVKPLLERRVREEHGANGQRAQVSALQRRKAKVRVVQRYEESARNERHNAAKINAKPKSSIMHRLTIKRMIWSRG